MADNAMMERVARAMTRYHAVSLNGKHVVYDNERNWQFAVAAERDTDAEAHAAARRFNAINVLTVLREPSQEMMQAAAEALHAARSNRTVVLGVWTAMIDAIRGDAGQAAGGGNG